MKKLIRLFILLIVVALASCKSICESEYYYLDDEDMQIHGRWSDGYESVGWQYRESASGANGNNTAGGGCGCN